MKKLIIIAILPITIGLFSLNGFCSCAVDGGVCGDAPTWDPCCNPDRYHCEKEDGADYGTCTPNEDAEASPEE